VGDAYAAISLGVYEIVGGVDEMGMIGPVFLGLYLGLVVLLHWGVVCGWPRRWAGWAGYLLSVLLYYLSAGGVGLGAYRFLQDSSFCRGMWRMFLMLWGVVFWIEERWGGRAVDGGGGVVSFELCDCGVGFWGWGFCFLRGGKGHGKMGVLRKGCWGFC